MTLQLTFKNQYLSITQFNPINLPDFVVLTGVNGSGKSHLLQAIEKKCVLISGMEDANIVLFNYETFKLENESAFNGQQLQSEKDAAWQFFQQQLKSPIHNWRNSHLGAEYETIKSQNTKEGKSLWKLASPSVNKFKQQIKNHFKNHNIKTNQYAQGIISLTKKIPYSIDEITQEEFSKIFKPFAYKHDFLPSQLGKVFWDYYLKLKENKINAFENQEDNGNRPVLTEKEFIEIHGPKPWELINQILQTFDTLKYKVNSPDGLSYFDNFQLKLQHTEKPNLQVEFNSLSSGEKILMALVASVYKSSSDGHFPDLLLLDEVDASLHPAMMKNMLSVIQDIFSIMA